MGQPDADIGLGRHAQDRANAVVELQQRDQRHLQRHDEKTDDHGDQDRPAGERHPGKRIGGEGRDRDRDDRRGYGNRERIDEGAADALSA
ncbi:hypothetical protein D9M72_503430 [compost metagenome]